MSTLYIDRRNLQLTLHGDALVFHENEQRINTVPLNVLQRICIHGNLSLTSSVLSKLGEAQIGVVILNNRQHRPTLLMPNLKLDGKRRQKQYQYSQEHAFCLSFSQNIIRQKIIHQVKLLNQFLPKHDIPNGLLKIAANIPFVTQIATLRGLEGAAAAQYFAAWQTILSPTWQFDGRNRRPPRDPINALLSLGYTLFHFEMVKHIYLCGLDPFIGFYHVTEHGRESLACDLLEPLRPQYDAWLLTQIIENQLFTPKDFSNNPQGCFLNKDARLRFYQHYETLAKTWRIKMHEHCRQLLTQLAPQDPDFDMGNFIAINSDESVT